MLQSPPHALRNNNNYSGAQRKKSAAWVVRKWLFLDHTGQAQTIESGKHTIMKRTGLPARDLRNLDPALSNPPSILGREQSIVLNLEHIRAIITAQEVIFLNYADPLVSPFIEKLQGIVISSQKERSGANNGSELQSRNEKKPDEGTSLNRRSSRDFPSKVDDRVQLISETQLALKNLPFEFVVLEECLKTTCSFLDNEAKTLELEAYPALDGLTTKISTLNLEHVRQIKSRLVAITGRVQKVRDELENLLDDDGDMAEMYLTEKLERQNELKSFSISSLNDPDDINEEVVEADINKTHDADSAKSESNDKHDRITAASSSHVLRRQMIHRTGASSQRAITTKPDAVELEMILETYFVQVEGTLNRLSNLREYVEDTEDYINIMLNDKQNHLLRMGVVLSTGTLVSSSFIVLTGIFGMNITIDLFDPKKAGMPDFLWVVAGGTLGCVLLFLAAIARYRRMRLLG